MAIRCEKIKYVYMPKTPFETDVYEDLNLTVNEGEILAIIGSTGAGKTTLTEMFNGLIMPQSGKIFVDDVEITKKNLFEIRKKVGYVFQYPEHQLFAESVKEDIAFGLKSFRIDNESKDSMILSACDLIKLKPELLDRSIYELSGGEKRRVAIAGVVVSKPKYLILDEPASGLDPAGKNEMLAFLKKMKSIGTTVVFVSHSMDDVAEIADRVVAFSDGKIIFDGTPKEVFSHYNELREIDLDVPQVTKLFRKLHEKYSFVNENIFTIKDGEEELLRLKNGGWMKS